MTRLLLLGLALLPACPAAACLNDRQVLVAENEFKSSYLKKDEPRIRVSTGGWIAVGAGAALLIATPLLLISRKR
ncbi:MAG: hypothetical protein ACAI43_09380 [Phycisphaerae bacterium]|nr:hypothetical protein [Tepidisphaeraceae bacterium]